MREELRKRGLDNYWKKGLKPKLIKTLEASDEERLASKAKK